MILSFNFFQLKQLISILIYIKREFMIDFVVLGDIQILFNINHCYVI